MRIIYVDVDTLRPDHLEPYGYARHITPNLSELAARGVTFDHYYTTDSPCAPSRAAWTTQQFGIVTGAIGNGGEAAQLRTTRGKAPWVDNAYGYTPFLGQYLYSGGLYTASISCFPPRHEAYWWVGNFREWLKPTLSYGDNEDAANVNAAAFQWLDRHAAEHDWFLHLHYWDPHIPYMVSSEWYDRAQASGPAPNWPDQATIDQHQTIYGPHTAVDLYEDDGAWRVPARTSPRPDTMPDAIATRADFEKLITGYDAGIMYWDHHFGQLLNHLADLKILDSTAIIVSSDHGEAFGENGVYGDHPLANDAIHHIPLIISWPGVTDALDAGARHSGAWQYNIDFGPTLCDLLGLRTPMGWPGQSFAGAVRGVELKGRPYLVLSHGAYSYQRAVRTPDYMYVRTLHPGCFRVDWDQFYDMRRDPHTTTNLAPARPTAMVPLQAALGEWWHTYAGSPLALGDPMQCRRHEGPSEAFSVAHYAARLRATGRETLAKELEQRSRVFWHQQD